jgi:protein dithiol:quinone oxidoreductase
MNLRSFRFLSALGFAACAIAMGFALYLEHFRGFEPCPLCVFQRVAMIVTGLTFLAGALHGPIGALRWLYAGLAATGSAAGAGIAGRHVWLQNLPPELVPACGPTLDYLMDMMPFMQVLATVLRGDGNCAIIDAAWLGLSLPTWTLISFIGLAAYALFLPFIARTSVPAASP